MQNRRPSITSRNRAYVVPEEVDVSFASAISLHRQAHATDMVAGLSHTEQRDLADKTEVQGGRAKAKRQRKVTIPEANTDALTTKPKAPREKALTARKPLIASNPGNAAIGSEVAAVSKPKKPRAKRAKDEAQTTITKGKVTKPASKDASAKTSKAVKATSTQKSDIVRQGDVQKECEKVTPNELGAETTEYGDQRRAIARRREWTPVKDTGAGAAILSNPASYIPLQKGISVHGCSRNTEFEALLNGYDYTKAHGKVTGPASVRNTDGEALTKRRKLEVSTSNAARTSGADLTIACHYEHSSTSSRAPCETKQIAEEEAANHYRESYSTIRNRGYVGGANSHRLLRVAYFAGSFWRRSTRL